MHISPSTKSVIAVGLLTLLLTCCSYNAAYAASATVVVPGVVFVEDGTVCVTVFTAEGKCEDLIPRNGKGLLSSGRIWDGCCVDVKITYDRGKHRGHVTVLK